MDTPGGSGQDQPGDNLKNAQLVSFLGEAKGSGGTALGQCLEHERGAFPSCDSHPQLPLHSLALGPNPRPALNSVSGIYNCTKN